MPLNKIYIICIGICLLAISCNKDNVLQGKMVNPDISSIKIEDRVIYIEETKGTKKKNTFYVDRFNQYVTGNVEGYELILYDVNNNNFSSTLTIYQYRDTMNSNLLDTGMRYTNSNLPPPPPEIGVQLNYFSDNVIKFFRATNYKPNNKVKITRTDAETLILEFSIYEMLTNSTVGTNYPIKATGRVVLKNKY